MTCIKTGAHAYLHCYDEWLLGDMFKVGNNWIMRVVDQSRDPIRPIKHFVIYNFDYWWDKHNTSPASPSTLVTHEVEDLGYEGVPL